MAVGVPLNALPPGVTKMPNEVVAEETEFGGRVPGAIRLGTFRRRSRVPVPTCTECGRAKPPPEHAESAVGARVASGVERAQKHVGIDYLRTGDLSDVGGHPACNRQSDDFGWVRS